MPANLTATFEILKAFLSMVEFLQSLCWQVIHTEEKPYICPECGKAFTDQSNLRQHRRAHEDSSELNCTVCQKRLSTPANLQRHMHIHDTRRTFTCSACGRGFSTSADLTRHERLHCDDKPYMCSVCRWTISKVVLSGKRNWYEFISVQFSLFYFSKLIIRSVLIKFSSVGSFLSYFCLLYTSDAADE